MYEVPSLWLGFSLDNVLSGITHGKGGSFCFLLANKAFPIQQGLTTYHH